MLTGQPNDSAMSAYGVDTTLLNDIYAHQHNTMWCWAACVEMIAALYSLEVEQEDIVLDMFGTDAFGNVPNSPANDDVFTNSFNLCDSQLTYCIDSERGSGFPDIGLLTHYLSNNIPVVVSYNARPGIGHAVLITRITCKWENGYDYISEIIVRDPANTTINRQRNGRRVISGNELQSFIDSVRTHWFVDVTRMPSESAFQDFAFPILSQRNPVLF